MRWQLVKAGGLWLGAVILAIMWSINQAALGFADPDAYYHIGMARLMAQQGVILDFPWLPYTTLAAHFTDQHALLHWLLIPFVVALPPLLGGKIWVVSSGLLTVAGLAWCMRRLGWRYWWLGTGLAAVTVSWTFRLNLVKATPLALLLLCLALVCVVEKRYWWLTVISFVYVWAHGGFFLVVLLVCSWIISQLTVGQRVWRDWLWLLLSCCGGLALALVVNPYFPDNLWFYWDQLVQIGVVNYQDVIGVGGEWYPYDAADLVLSTVLLSVVWLAGAVVTIAQRQRISAVQALTMLLWLGTFVLTLKSRRYIEYYVPTLALALTAWWQSVPPPLQLLHQIMNWPIRSQLATAGVLFVFITLATPVVLADQQTNFRDLALADSPQKYFAAAQWLHTTAQPGDKLLHSDWDDFPIWFYFTPKLVYMAGLDATFMYKADSERYWLWENITTGEYSGDIDAALTTLDIRYVAVDTDHTGMERLIRTANRATEVYRDNYITLFSVEPLDE